MLKIFGLHTSYKWEFYNHGTVDHSAIQYRASLCKRGPCTLLHFYTSRYSQPINHTGVKALILLLNLHFATKQMSNFNVCKSMMLK